MSDQSSSPQKMPRRLRWLLIGSLTVNFLVAGVVIGGALAHWRGPDGPRGDHVFDSPYTRALERGDRRAIGKAIRRHYEGGGTQMGRRAAGKTFRDVVTLLRASPLDIDALRDLSEKQDGQMRDRQNVAREAWLSHIQSMSDAERAAYADRLEYVLQHDMRGRGPMRP